MISVKEEHRKGEKERVGTKQVKEEQRKEKELF
eukprot:CAMPEP_0185746900 /NCGR_PEP_ID=MMETSP1174-20130828/5557_1 /TAXON_ID=35687 /ORGANISM="Dictyocha speculum, Strain CCMP1381" /LENGTH=32 /DNA_ID= /DNA_START= /DNA_END= /DNA_ORIENTATION=